MSIAVLSQVYDEMRRLAIAGSVVAGGDFRLKKLVPALEQAGAKAPVFAKVGESLKKLVESDERTSAEALLELSTLVNAILYTQGETGLAGKLEAIETTDLGPQTTQAGARVLKPLLIALSTTGSGRMEVIKDSHERGAFRDLRLVKPALDGIDDVYPEIGDFLAEHVLPLYGKAILPELKAKYDLKGRGGHVRRLGLMHKLDPAGTRETVKNALENGSKEMKIAAIECLGDSSEDLNYLLEQAKAKAKDVRIAALKSLVKLDLDEARAALEAATKTADLESLIWTLKENVHPKFVKFLIGECEAELAAIFKTKDKKALSKSTERLMHLLVSLSEREDKATEAFLLDAFGRRDEIAGVKGEPSGLDINGRVVMAMSTGSKKTQAKLVESHGVLDADGLELAFTAACRSLKPAEVYDRFSPYLTAKVDEKKKDRDPAWAKREAICNDLSGGYHGHYGWYYRRYYATRTDDEKKTEWDPRWLDLAIKIKHMEVIHALARPNHTAVNKLLAEEFEASVKKSKDLHECSAVLDTMIRVGHPAATESLLAVLKKHAKGKYSWGVYWVGRLIPDLPKSALPELEALLPTLAEKAVDELMDYVQALRNKE